MRNRVPILIGSVLIVLSALTTGALLVKRDPPTAPPATVEAQEEPEVLVYWRSQAEAAEQAGLPAVAADYRDRMAAFERPIPAWPSVETAVGAIAPSSFELYLRNGSPASGSASKLAKHEPLTGTYLGMLGADRRVSYDVTKVQEVYGRKHAIYLAYVGWRKVQTDTNTYFPATTAKRVKALDGALQIGWEPRYGLNDVQDDEYVRRFAREAAASGIPIFLRYASEMNGAWVPWHGDPAKYIEKFRLVHDIMKEEAPNVAMVWSPNFSPADSIDEYYPGDEYVDWVGFSLYSTPLTGGKEDLKGNVIDSFASLYAKYSHKPIMISEGAIAHTVLSNNQTYWKWAEGQLGYMYGFLPRMFPQVKAITYFNFSRAQAQRTGMEYVYDLGENPFTDSLYKRLIRSDYFLSGIQQGAEPVKMTYTPWNGKPLSPGKYTIMPYVKLEDGTWPFAVALYQGDRRIGLSYEMPWEMEVSLQSSEPLHAVAYNQRQEPVAVTSFPAAAK